MALKELVAGDEFTTCYDTGSSKLNDTRTFIAVSDHEVRLIKPSPYQVASDVYFRDGSFDGSFVSLVEPEWYRRRGYVFNPNPKEDPCPK